MEPRSHLGGLREHTELGPPCRRTCLPFPSARPPHPSRPMLWSKPGTHGLGHAKDQTRSVRTAGLGSKGAEHHGCRGSTSSPLRRYLGPPQTPAFFGGIAMSSQLWPPDCRGSATRVEILGNEYCGEWAGSRQRQRQTAIRTGRHVPHTLPSLRAAPHQMCSEVPKYLGTYQGLVVGVREGG